MDIMDHPLVRLIALVWACQVVNLAGRVVVARGLGADIEEVSLFFGPKVLEFRHGGIPYRLGLVPLGNYVRFADDPETPGAFRSLHPMTRLAIIGSADAALMLLACLLLGPSHALNSLGHGFEQVIRGALAPASTAQMLIRGLLDLLDRESLGLGLGVVAAKVAAVNLLPLPALSGGQLILNLVGGRRGLPGRVQAILQGLGLAVGAAFAVGWLVAFGRAALGR
jgi:membrane-associated protease RseP (regulator of RpoE activity)